MADPFFDRAAAPARPKREGSPLGGLLVVVALLGVLFVVMQGRSVAPGPGPGPDDGAVTDPARAAEVAGRLEDRLYADAFERLADETAAGKYETAEAWHAEAKQRLYDARYQAQKPVHQAIQQIFPHGTIEDGAAAAAGLREIAKGYRRSGR